MNRVAIAAAAAVVGVISSTAYAADLTPAYKPPVPAVSPAYNWTGVYVGVNGGYGWGSQDPYNIITNRFDKFSTGISGGLFGGTIGAQVQVQYIVLGLEADLDWAGIKGSTTANPTVGGFVIQNFPITAQTNIDWLGTARVRAGIAANNWLFYATGGVAAVGAKTTLTTVGGGTLCGAIFGSCSGTDRQLGGAAGLGVEYGITPNISAKLEYLYVSAFSLEVSSQNQIRAGLNYRFGGM